MSQLNKLLSSNDSEFINYVTPFLEKNIIDILCVTIADNNKQMFDKLIKTITNIETDNIKKMILCAIAHGRYEILEFLLSKTNIANIDNDPNNTLIYYTIHVPDFNEDHMKCLVLLIKAGCPFDDCENRYILIFKLMYSLLKGNKIDIFDEKINVSLPTDEEFLKHISTYPKDYPEINMMCKTIINNDVRMFHRYLEIYQIVNRHDNDQESTPIMHASQWGRYKMLKILLEKGASITEKITTIFIGKMKSALYFAVSHPRMFNEGHIECIKLLLKAGAKTDILKQYSMIDYYLIEFIRERIQQDYPPIEKPLKLFNKSGTEYTIIKSEPVQPKNLLIEVLSKVECSEEYVVGKLYGSYHIVRLYDGSAIRCTIYSKNVEINVEIPKCSESYHLLPVGILLDGVKLTKPTPCRFIEGYVTTDGSNNVSSISDMY